MTGPQRSVVVPEREEASQVVRSVLIGASVVVGCVLLLGVVHGSLAAVVAVPIAVIGVRVLARRAQRVAVDPSVPLTLDLAAAALRAGFPVPDALIVAAPAASTVASADLLRVAGLLRLGADAAQAWREVGTGPLTAVAAAAVRSATSGIRLAESFERAAGEHRAETARIAVERAQRAGVAAMGPLAACFLPSFVCLGIIPVVIGIARSALGTL